MASPKSLKQFTYLSGFLLSVHLAFPGYINSSFLGQIVDTERVGLVFAVASLLAILALNLLTLVLKNANGLDVFIALVAIISGLILALASAKNSTTIIILFIFYYVLSLLVQYLIDLYLESLSDDNDTGRIRGFFLAVINLAIMISLVTVGFVLGDKENYQFIYLLSLAPLLPLLYIAVNKLEKVIPKTEPKPIGLPGLPETDQKHQVWSDLKRLIRPVKGSHEANLRNILAIDFLLNFFYTFMIIYLPIHLHQNVGLAWPAIGLIFAFMLTPFIFFLYPLGRLADDHLGEKEILSVGLVIAGGTSIAIGYLAVPSVIAWGALMFANRVGASAIEGMKEAYLFKQLSAADIGIISISRNTRPLASVIGPVVATGFLWFFDFRFLFVFLGLVMFFGLRYSLALMDTK